MNELNEKLLNAFKKMDRLEFESLIRQGADKQIIIDYTKKVNGWDLSISQSWMLKDFIYND